MDIALYVLLGLLCLAAILAAGWLFAVKPAKRREETRDYLVAYAHRGLHSPGIPENSLAAFRAAAQAGYAMELDVQITKDGKLIVFHDDTLKRMCGVEGDVRDATYQELATLRLAGTGERIPLFSEVLDAVGGRAPLLIEIKAHRSAGDTRACRLLALELEGYEGPYCMESFNPFMVAWFKKNMPRVVRGQLSSPMAAKGRPLGERLRYFALQSLLFNFVARPDFIAYAYSGRGLLGFRACARVFKPALVAWTITSPQDYSNALNTFNAVIFEGFTPPKSP